LALGVAAAGGLTYWSQVDAWGTMTQVFALFGIAFALPGGLAAYATPAKG
jgi:hypothetical protein